MPVILDKTCRLPLRSASIYIIGFLGLSSHGAFANGDTWKAESPSEVKTGALVPTYTNLLGNPTVQLLCVPETQKGMQVGCW